MTGSFWGYFLFSGLAGFYIAWLECVCHLFQELYFASSPGVWHEIRPCVHGDLCSLNWFPYTYFRWRKGRYFRFRVLANHSTSFFFLHPVRRFVRTTISFTQVKLRGTDSLTHIFFFLQQAGRSWPTFLIPPFNGQSLVACKFKHGGVGGISYFSPSQW